MKKIRALIVEDEPLARATLRRLVKAEQDLLLLGECADGHAALETIRAQRPELVFLDVRLPEMNGFDVLEALDGPPPAVIFVTAHDGYAARAFEWYAADYLLKPFTGKRFKEALQRVRDRLARHNSPLRKCLEEARERVQRRPPSHSTISLKVEDRIVLVRVDEIEAIVADKVHCVVHTLTGRHRTRRPLSDFEVQLGAGEFIRISRSTLINQEHLQEFAIRTHGDGTIRLRSGTEFPASRRYRRHWSPGSA